MLELEEEPLPQPLLVEKSFLSQAEDSDPDYASSPCCTQQYHPDNSQTLVNEFDGLKSFIRIEMEFLSSPGRLPSPCTL